MIKIPIYQVLKINSGRLHDSNYNLTLTYEQAIINEEIIGLGSSQLLRIIRKECNYPDNVFFMKEIVSVVIEHKYHYNEIKHHGFTINGIKYTRFVCSAANARTSTVFFIREELHDKIFNIMCCGIDPIKKELSLAKWNAYFALNASSSYPIREPRVAVIKDHTTTIDSIFEFANGYQSIETKEMKIENYPNWDGMGLMSNEFANVISEDLDLGYIPSVAIIRNTFIKGALATMDFKMFDKEIMQGNGIIVDLWGDKHKLSELDVILTASQFKMFEHYKNWEEYLNAEHKFNLGWGVTRVSYSEDDSYTFTNYQFLQVLDLKQDEDIKGLCQPTIDWIRDVAGCDVNKAILYLCGTEGKLDINSLNDYLLKSLLYNHKLIEDGYIRHRILRSLNKKIRQAYAGKLIVNGNFSFMLCDPFGLLEYACGLEPKGILKAKEYYNDFWNQRNVSTISVCRSPLTWMSENNVVSLTNNELVNKWFKYLRSSSTILNMYGVDTFIMSDSDFDGDIVFTTDNEYFIKGKSKKYLYPITWEKVKTPKSKLTLKKLYDVDMLSFGTRIGFITNCSTYWYSLLSEYQESDKEYTELIRRLKFCRVAQGNEIDKTKGLCVDPFPKEWYQDTGEDNLKLLATKKPYFQKYIYPALNQKYKDMLENLDMVSRIDYDVNLEDNHDKKFLDFKKASLPLLDNDSIMNRICHYLEKEIEEFKTESKYQNQQIIDYVLIDTDREIKKEYTDFFTQCYKRYKEYLKFLRNSKGKVSREIKNENKIKFDIYCNDIKKEVFKVIPNPIDVANLAVWIAYGHQSNDWKNFIWDVFGKEIFYNVLKNTPYAQENLQLPIKDINGDIEYLGSKYSMVNVGCK